MSGSELWLYLTFFPGLKVFLFIVASISIVMSCGYLGLAFKHSESDPSKRDSCERAALRTCAASILCLMVAFFLPGQAEGIAKVVLTTLRDGEVRETAKTLLEMLKE